MTLHIDIEVLHERLKDAISHLKNISKEHEENYYDLESPIFDIGLKNIEQGLLILYGRTHEWRVFDFTDMPYSINDKVSPSDTNEKTFICIDCDTLGYRYEETDEIMAWDYGDCEEGKLKKLLK